MKRLWWCLAVFVISVALGNFVAPPVISSMKPLANGEHVVEWSDGTREVFNVTGPKKDAMVTVGDEQMEISRFSMETPQGLVFFFPWEPEHRSFAFYDVSTATTAPLDYVGPVEVNGLRALRFSGEFGSADSPDSPGSSDSPDRVTRTFDVERRTGGVVAATRTTADGEVTLAASTQDELVREASSRVRILWWLQFLALAGRVFAVLAAVMGLIILVRRV
ncbi:porin PorA family protein [Corynebacterium sp. MSK044]|uniref:porin PorA family protein n=1 Tax=Corynebacterium sp. MSK044 TaxID=3050195 RepID=UPI00254FCFD1|nr:porin PorA family protein [Corynebacterium sp. MSK044]MDK8797859.1 porin PorA family protein [Corynebacterium sp. MSK044]